MKKVFQILVILAISMTCVNCVVLDKLSGLSEDMEQKAEESTSSKNLDSDKWDIEKLDTARNVDYLSVIEKDVVLEMNKARSNPALYAQLYLEPRIKKFSGKIYDGNLMTNEGVNAVNDCISVMKKTKALALLIPERGLSLAAQKHSSTQGETDQTGHTGVDGSTPFTRIQKYVTYKAAGENISYGSKSGRDIVVQLLIDDGVPSRGHRKNILSKDFSSTGVGYSKQHKLYGSVCVITYAGRYSEN